MATISPPAAVTTLTTSADSASGRGA